MAPLSTLDIYVGLAAIIVAAGAIYLFIKASSSSDARKREPSVGVDDEFIAPLLRETRSLTRRYRTSASESLLKRTDIDKAESKIRTLTLQSELLSIVLKRLFEAEDDGEITREERASLSRGYETDLKRISEDLRQAELVVSLNELETIRDDIVKKFEATLNSTQSRIDTIVQELKLEREVKVERPLPRRRRPAVEIPEVEEEEAPEEEADEGEAERPRTRRPRSDVEQRLEQLRGEVLKELEELDKLELEA